MLGAGLEESRIIEKDMHYVIERGVDLLDDEWVARGHHMVYGDIAVDAPARAAGQSERQQPHVLGDIEPAPYIWAPGLCGKPDGSVLRTRQILELISKDLVPALTEGDK